VAFTRSAIRSGKGGAEAWLAVQGERFARVRAMLAEIGGEGPLTVARLLVAAGQLGDLI
jgi:NAD-specific glutamate dehydrogenase